MTHKLPVSVSGWLVRGGWYEFADVLTKCKSFLRMVCTVDLDKSA